MTVLIAHGGYLFTQHEYRLIEPDRLADRVRSRSARVAVGDTSQFTPIGMGQPLTIRIAHVYTGRYPVKSLFRSKQDMLLTSAIKGYSVFEGAPRAIQFYERQVSVGTDLQTSSAPNQGTSLVFYTPAVTDASLTLTLELAFDSFPDDLLQSIGTGLQSLSGMPIFMPYAGYLMIGSQLARLAGDVGRALFEGQPEFARTETLDFDLPGYERPEAAFRIVASPSFDYSDLQFEPRIGLVHRSNPRQAYDGEQPYIVLSLDGRADSHLESFQPTLASAELLNRVIGSTNKAQSAIDLLVEAAQLSNDAKFRTEADRIQREIDSLTKEKGSGPEVERLTAQRTALVKNIRSDLLKPPAQVEPAVVDPEHDKVADPNPAEPALDRRARRSVAIAATAVRNWRVAHSLLRLRDQIDAAHPNRNRSNDGTIGDAKHASRKSDHNPWVIDDGVGVVTAIDITHDPENGCDAGDIVARLIASEDRRIKYIIYASHIMSSYPKDGAAPWQPRPYDGPNKHDEHFHLSVLDTPDAFDDTRVWNV